MHLDLDREHRHLGDRHPPQRHRAGPGRAPGERAALRVRGARDQRAGPKLGLKPGLDDTSGRCGRGAVRATGGARTRPADGVACERAGLARRRGCVPGANRLQRHPAQQLPHARRGLRGERRGHHRRAPRGGHPRRRPARAPPRRPPVRTHPDRHAPDRARRRRRGARPAHPARGRGRRPGHGRRPRRAHRRHPHRRPASCLSGRHGRRGNDAVYSRFSSSGGGSRTSISGCSVTSSAGTNAIRMPHPA